MSYNDVNVSVARKKPRKIYQFFNIDPKTRNAFVRKVFLIVLLMLTVTAIFNVIVNVICISVITAYATVKTETKLVIFALVATAALVMVLIMIAYSSWDFTRWWNYIIAASVALFAVSLAISIYSWSTGERMKTVKIVICIIGTVVNSVVLIMELQSIIGGKTVELEEELYLYGAWQLYTSIVHIFLKLLRIMRYFGH
ncbi:hypothetical protein ABMA27_010308 [Loxostege sticticalis]|uniref:Uncharacterized protein n=1 Tax=Loxostege sticticalis TaxID=481309 RepID=A0ABR3H5C0_LOXSC